MYFLLLFNCAEAMIIVDNLMQTAHERCAPMVSYFTCSSIVPRKRLTENDENDRNSLLDDFMLLTVLII